MFDDMVKVLTVAEVQDFAERCALYFKSRGFCMCMHCLIRLCEHQRAFASHVIVAAHRLSGVPVLLVPHDEQTAYKPDTRYRTPHY